MSIPLFFFLVNNHNIFSSFCGFGSISSRNMLKFLIVLFILVLAGSFALDCKTSRSNVRGDGGPKDLHIQDITCDNETLYCVTLTGLDKSNITPLIFCRRRQNFTEKCHRGESTLRRCF